jgi:hypothetical protein
VTGAAPSANRTNSCRDPVRPARPSGAAAQPPSERPARRHDALTPSVRYPAARARGVHDLHRFRLRHQRPRSDIDTLSRGALATRSDRRPCRYGDHEGLTNAEGTAFSSAAVSCQAAQRSLRQGREGRDGQPDSRNRRIAASSRPLTDKGLMVRLLRSSDREARRSRPSARERVGCDKAVQHR